MSDNPNERVVLIDPLEIDEDGVLRVDGPSTSHHRIGGSETTTKTIIE